MNASHSYNASSKDYFDSLVDFFSLSIGFSNLVKISYYGTIEHPELMEIRENPNLRQWLCKWIQDYISYLKKTTFGPNDFQIAHLIMRLKMSETEISNMQAVIKELFIAQIAVTLSMIQAPKNNNGGSNQHQNQRFM